MCFKVAMRCGASPIRLCLMSSLIPSCSVSIHAYLRFIPPYTGHSIVSACVRANGTGRRERVHGMDPTFATTSPPVPISCGPVTFVVGGGYPASTNLRPEGKSENTTVCDTIRTSKLIIDGANPAARYTSQLSPISPIIQPNMPTRYMSSIHTLPNVPDTERPNCDTFP